MAPLKPNRYHGVLASFRSSIFGLALQNLIGDSYLVLL